MTVTDISTEAKPEPRLGWWAAAMVALAVAVIPAALFPGDAAWAYDEPQLVAISTDRANQAHLQVTHGLAGNFPLPYGPLPAQLHQLLLLISHDPRWLVLIRGTAFALVAALLLLGLRGPSGSTRGSCWQRRRAPDLWGALRTHALGCNAGPAAGMPGAGGDGGVPPWRRTMAAADRGGGVSRDAAGASPSAPPLAAAILGHLLWRRSRRDPPTCHAAGATPC